MISQLANILKNALTTINNGENQPTGLLFIDKLAGIVVVGEKAQPTEIEGAFAVSKFPISLDSDYEDCINKGCYKDLVPNSRQKGVLYFEDYGTTPVNRERGSFNYKSRLRLVCWINNKLIQGNNCKSVNHILITQIRKALEVGYFNASDLSRIRVTSTNIIENDYKLFEKYTYPKEVLKYLMHPYEAFGIDLVVEYSISENCLPELEMNPEIC